MNKFYRTNNQIQAASLRVIDSEGQQLGVLTKQEALEKAQALGLDLVEIAPNVDPPVARILDFQKFRYQENKKERQANKGSSEGGLKELWLSPRIADHDLMVRLRRTEEFLNDGYKVKLTIKFKGREMGHPELGHRVLQKAINHFGEKIAVEREPKFEGRKLSAIIGRSKGGPKVEKVDNVKTENQ